MLLARSDQIKSLIYNVKRHDLSSHSNVYIYYKIIIKFIINVKFRRKNGNKYILFVKFMFFSLSSILVGQLEGKYAI